MSNATAVSSVSFEHQKSDLETCPVLPPNLVGPIQVWMDTPSMETLGQLYPELASGGHGQPKECRARHRVAIIIPYRLFAHSPDKRFTKSRLIGNLEIERAI